MQATNSEIDGGTLVFIGLLTVIISPNLYQLKIIIHSKNTMIIGGQYIYF